MLVPVKVLQVSNRIYLIALYRRHAGAFRFKLVFVYRLYQEGKGK